MTALLHPSKRAAALGAAVLVLRLAACASRAGAQESAGLPARPADSAGEPRWSDGGGWISLGVLTGSTQPDAQLADYQWDTRPRMAWGLQALAGRGRFGAGLRLWSNETTQRLDLAGVMASPTVHSTSYEVVARGRLASFWGARVLACASGGLLHLGYDPDRMTIPVGGPGSTIEAVFSPVNEWVSGIGGAVERPLGGRWTAGVQVDWRSWGLDTAHRSGAVIVNSRESFGEWSARFELARVLTRR